MAYRPTDAPSDAVSVHRQILVDAAERPNRTYSIITYSLVMATTVQVKDATLAQLRVLKERTGAPSIDAVIHRLLHQGQPTARQLFARHGEAVARALTRAGATEVIAFGSRARGDAGPDSDLDLVVTFRKGTSLLDQARLERELSTIFGVPVSIIGPGALEGMLAEAVARDGVCLVP